VPQMKRGGKVIMLGSCFNGDLHPLLPLRLLIYKLTADAQRKNGGACRSCPIASDRLFCRRGALREKAAAGRAGPSFYLGNEILI